MPRTVPPSVTFPSPNEWPKTTRALTGITRNSQATVTCPNHGFTAQDVGLTQVMFLQVKGMTQINGLPASVVSVIDPSNFVCTVNTTQFSPYSSAGIISILTGQPPVETLGQQIFNTPFQNTF